MNAITSTSSSLIVPVPASPIAIRVATMADLPFMDGLQKRFNRALGYFPTKQFEGYIEGGHVLVAERSTGYSVPSTGYAVPSTEAKAFGYVISRDRYLKRDELGVIYQLCVAPGFQRGLIGASLIKAVFDRAAYGCRLFCCWCAQDLEANYFWESLGFVPIAFRAGSTGKKRVHIFWQRRVVEGTGERATPWWYPSQTSSGAIREDRLVFPIPPGVHWSQVQAVAVPTRQPALEAPREKAPRTPKPARPKGVLTTASSGLRFGPVVATTANPPQTKPARPVKAKQRIDPKLVAAARELRDRYLERANDSLLTGPRGKYEVSRALGGDVKPEVRQIAA